MKLEQGLKKAQNKSKSSLSESGKRQKFRAQQREISRQSRMEAGARGPAISYANIHSRGAGNNLGTHRPSNV